MIARTWSSRATGHDRLCLILLSVRCRSRPASDASSSSSSSSSGSDSGSDSGSGGGSNTTVLGKRGGQERGFFEARPAVCTQATAARQRRQQLIGKRFDCGDGDGMWEVLDVFREDGLESRGDRAYAVLSRKFLIIDKFFSIHDYFTLDAESP